MEILKNLTLFLLLFLVKVSFCNDNENEDDDFVATTEWQVVKKGQKIPKGLHVRINFETGITEAKLLDPHESSDKSKSLLQISPPDENKGDDILDADEIKKIKDEFRSYDEIKKSLGDLNLTPKMDSEVIADLLKKHADCEEEDDEETILRVIEDLEFLAHQYDNAIEFVNQNGFSTVIYKNLNSTNAEIKKETLKLMGALMQNNNKPKIHALETGAIAVLLRLINFESDNVVKTRAITALSSLLRSFPVAQKTFLGNGGLSVVSKIFASDDVKLQIKIVTLISDLIVEHKYAVTDENLSKYYTDSYDLEKSILDNSWCENLNTLLLTLVVTDEDNHDSIEKCLTAMHTIKDRCASRFKLSLVENLKRRYKNLSESDLVKEDSGNSAFFSALEKLCGDIVDDAKKSNLKTEL